MSYSIKNVHLRVVKEPDSGITEIFVTKRGTPDINFSDHIKGDVDVESGSYDLEFKPASEPETLPIPEPDQIRVVGSSEEE